MIFKYVYKKYENCSHIDSFCLSSQDTLGLERAGVYFLKPLNKLLGEMSHKKIQKKLVFCKTGGGSRRVVGYSYTDLKVSFAVPDMFNSGKWVWNIDLRIAIKINQFEVEQASGAMVSPLEL